MSLLHDFSKKANSIGLQTQGIYQETHETNTSIIFQNQINEDLCNMIIVFSEIDEQQIIDIVIQKHVLGNNALNLLTKTNRWNLLYPGYNFCIQDGRVLLQKEIITDNMSIIVQTVHDCRNLASHSISIIFSNIRKIMNNSKNSKNKKEKMISAQQAYYNTIPGACARFLVGDRNVCGTIGEVLNYSDVQLENNHKYIQYVFPLKERSLYNIQAPVLTDKEIEWIKSSKGVVARVNMVTMLRKMLQFYGFTSDFEKAEDYEQRSKNWITPYNHNYKRITRILKCLRLCDLDYFASQFYNLLCTIYMENQEIIGETSFQYWTDAVKGPM